MKYGVLLLLISVVACQQPATTSFEESDILFKKNKNVPQMVTESVESGIVTWTNKPGHAGKITTSSGSVYTYNVNAGHTVDGYRPVVGNAVLFNTGTGASARFVRPFDLPNEEDDDSDGDEGEDEDEEDETPAPPPIW